MRKSVLIFALFGVLIGCNNIAKEELTIIDKIVLGKSMTHFSKSMDSLSIPHQRFITKRSLLLNFDDLMDQSNYLNMYYTNVFNFSDSRSSSNDNLGLLYPIGLTGTDSNIGMVVLLGHTGNPSVESHLKNSVNAKYFQQDVNENVIKQIKDLYISKYGKPTYESNSKINSFYVIEKNQINKYSDTTRVGNEIVWETKYVNIKLFAGLDSYDSSYDNDEKSYSDILWSYGERIIQKNNLEYNYIPCYSYAFIKYELNSVAIEKLKLDNKKI